MFSVHNQPTHAGVLDTISSQLILALSPTPWHSEIEATAARVEEVSGPKRRSPQPLRAACQALSSSSPAYPLQEEAGLCGPEELQITDLFLP
jgi:hypothetical protein